MTVANGSFETQAPGSPIGQADQWSASEVSTAESYAEFAVNPGEPDTSGQETFELGWYPPLAQDFVGEFTGFFTDISPVFFDGGTQPFEDLENLWGTVLLAAAGLQDGVFTPGGAGEDAEAGWGTTPLSSVDISLTPAAFDVTPEDFEDFEDDWGGLDLTLPGATLVFFTEVTSLVTYERFDVVRLDLDSVTVDPATDVITRSAHGLAASDPITFKNESGRLPAGLQSSTTYLVFNQTTNTLQVRAVAGGAAIDILDNGFGTHFIVHSPNRYWIDEVEGV